MQGYMCVAGYGLTLQQEGHFLIHRNIDMYV